MIKNFTILGERCSGTNYLQALMEKNFSIPLTWKYGFKHWFGFSDYKNSDETLFIGIVRNPLDWMCSLYRREHSLKENIVKNWKNFLTSEFTSYNCNAKSPGFRQELKEGRHIYTKEKYKNIFECREVKCQFLKNEMPVKVKNYILIKYEDLASDYKNVLKKIESQFSLPVKNLDYEDVRDYVFPIGENQISKKFKKRKYWITPNALAFTMENFSKSKIEKELGYYPLNTENIFVFPFDGKGIYHFYRKYILKPYKARFVKKIS